MNAAIKNELDKCKTLQQFFDTVTKHYDTNEELGVATKIVIKTNLPKLLTMANVKPKK